MYTVLQEQIIVENYFKLLQVTGPNGNYIRPSGGTRQFKKKNV